MQMPVSMKLFAHKQAALALILISLTSLCIITIALVWASGDSWASKTPMQEARAYLGVAVVNGKIYAIGGDIGSETGSGPTGYPFSGHAVNTTEEYDPAADKWTSKAPMPTARALFGIAVYQNKIYCIGGYYAVFTYKDDRLDKTEYFNTGANEVYDPATNTWETKASMPTPSTYAASRPTTANVVNGKIYLIGNGLNNVYDPTTDSWITKTPPPYQITSYASVVVDDKTYFISARKNSSGLRAGAFFQIYDSLSDSWSIGANSPTYGDATAAGATTGVNAPKRIYFFEEITTYSYDIASDSWTTGASMPTARLIATVAIINDTFYVVGGRSGQHGVITIMYPSTVNEQYTPIGYGSVSPELVYAAAAGAAAITIIIITAVALKKRHQKNTS